MVNMVNHFYNELIQVRVIADKINLPCNVNLPITSKVLPVDSKLEVSRFKPCNHNIITKAVMPISYPLPIHIVLMRHIDLYVDFCLIPHGKQNSFHFGGSSP